MCWQGSLYKASPRKASAGQSPTQPQQSPAQQQQLQSQSQLRRRQQSDPAAVPIPRRTLFGEVSGNSANMPDENKLGEKVSLCISVLQPPDADDDVSCRAAIDWTEVDIGESPIDSAVSVQSGVRTGLPEDDELGQLRKALRFAEESALSCLVAGLVRSCAEAAVAEVMAAKADALAALVVSTAAKAERRWRDIAAVDSSLIVPLPSTQSHASGVYASIPYPPTRSPASGTWLFTVVVEKMSMPTGPPHYVDCRYSDFRAMHNALVASGTTELPPFPPSRWYRSQACAHRVLEGKPATLPLVEVLPP